MALEDRVMQALKEAMKAKDQASMRTLRAIKAELLLYKTSGAKGPISEADEVRILQKMIKQRKDSLAVYQEQGRTDLATTEQEEVDVLTRYLPEQMSEDELRSFIAALVDELGAAGMKDMGRVMGEASKRLGGKAEGKVIASIVKEKLG